MRKLLFVLPFLIFGCGSGEKAEGPVFTSEGVALSGYDPVAYFEQNEAKKGVETESVEYEGFTYLFSSTKNKNIFQEDPEKYLPAYGGWCAYAVAEASNRMAPDPQLWQIQDGQLQLFYDDWQTRMFGSLKEEWNEDPKNYKTKADANWQKMN